MDKKQVMIVVGLIANEQGQALIAKRNDPELVGGHEKWELIGGKIEFGEDPEEAIKREVLEESGLEVVVTGLGQKIINRLWHKADGQYQVLLVPYHCRVVGGKLHDKTFDHKISELKFITKDEVDNFDYIGPREKELVLMTFVD